MTAPKINFFSRFAPPSGGSNPILVAAGLSTPFGMMPMQARASNGRKLREGKIALRKDRPKFKKNKNLSTRIMDETGLNFISFNSMVIPSNFIARSAYIADQATDDLVSSSVALTGASDSWKAYEKWKQYKLAIIGLKLTAVNGVQTAQILDVTVLNTPARFNGCSFSFNFQVVIPALKRQCISLPSVKAAATNAEWKAQFQASLVGLGYDNTDLQTGLGVTVDPASGANTSGIWTDDITLTFGAGFTGTISIEPIYLKTIINNPRVLDEIASGDFFGV